MDPKTLQFVAALVAGAGAFGAGVYLMNGNKTPAPANPPAPVAQAPAPKPPEPKPPEPGPVAGPPVESNKAEAGKADPPRMERKFVVTNPPKLVQGKWGSLSGYALPNPRKLTDQEKAALKLLGGAVDVHTFQFTSTTLDDGSTIPGVPALSSEEVHNVVMGKIRAKGLADGFEDAIRGLAVHNPKHLTVKISQEANWADLDKILGINVKLDPDKGSTVYFGKREKRTSYRIQWISSGWLGFGVDSGKVRFIQASFPGFLVHAPEFIAAEEVPGGRSDPDPAKALKTSKARPLNAEPRSIEALRKLGKVSDVKIVPYSGKSDMVAAKKAAADLVGKPLYPDLPDTGRSFKGGGQILAFIVTPSASLTLDQLTDIMPDTRMRHEDPRTFPGMKLTWYSYYWLEFGIAEGQVKKVKVHCQTIPKTIEK